MRKIIQISCLLVTFMLVTLNAQAQKFGYIDSEAILQEMPEVKQAQANLEVLRKQLQAKGKQMVTNLETKYQGVVERQKAGSITEKELKAEEQILQEQQADIGKFEQEMIKQLSEKEKKELQPIFDRVDKAIKDVAKENNYQFVFEKRTLLYSDSSMDIGNLVRAKLGMN